jgi:hypothetical protein
MNLPTALAQGGEKVRHQLQKNRIVIHEQDLVLFRVFAHFFFARRAPV